MDVDRIPNNEDSGVIDFKEKVLEIYPEAYCLKHNRKTYYYRMDNGIFTDVVRYSYDIVIDRNGSIISTSKYTEEGAWEYAWHYVEHQMMYMLEN